MPVLPSVFFIIIVIITIIFFYLFFFYLLIQIYGTKFQTLNSSEFIF